MTDIVEKQSLALQELTTPTIQLWEGILILPIVGIVDSNRAQIMTTAMLTKIQQTASRTIIIDITGVATVDSGVANHLIKITKATRLMGCTCILSGIGPEVAQILVHLGLSLESVETSGNLQSAFKTALLRSGQTITEKQPDGAR
ncbi:MAG: STAS domain-containing protein [Gammaproteobacteria bacterium]|nr:STAS domain-containing protein [Gammaproteobacteria bacterium]